MKGNPPGTPVVPPAVRAELLALAREAIARHLETGSALDMERAPHEDGGGIFITLRIDGELRGCIGWPEHQESLRYATARCAVAAAVHDPRFPPLTAEELPRTRIEISVLSPPVEVRDPSEIVVGRDGLVIERGGARGLLLPQVPVEQGWDRTAFLEGLCRKAGLPPDAWRKGASLARFTADVFAEPDLP